MTLSRVKLWVYLFLAFMTGIGVCGGSMYLLARIMSDR